jgi:hypothetical protein
VNIPSPTTLASIFSGVTRPMLGFPFEVDRAEPTPDLYWRSGVMRIGGATPFSLAISSDEAGCGALASSIFGERATLELIDDALRELVNVTAGALKWRLRIDEQALVVPRVAADGKPPLGPSADTVALVLRGRAGVRIALSISWA